MVVTVNAQVKAKLIWITGLSGSGKTTLGRNLVSQIKSFGDCNIFHLDGDEMRDICSNDLGYEYPDRLQNARRISNLAISLVNQNVNVVCSTISFFQNIRDHNRNVLGSNYIEVFVDAGVEDVRDRSLKKVYDDKDGKAVGVEPNSQHYEYPVAPDLRIVFPENIDNCQLCIDKILRLYK